MTFICVFKLSAVVAGPDNSALENGKLRLDKRLLAKNEYVHLNTFHKGLII